MKLTKYSHACFVLEKDGASVIVDPGGWSTDLVVPDTVVAVVVTHEHGDHWDMAPLKEIVSKNPDVVIYTHHDVAEKLDGLPVHTVAVGETVHVGDFALEFSGGEHALIHGSIPPVANIGVIVDDLVYYPGDSFALPGKTIPVHAIPAAAPWMKLAEAIDYLTELQPKRAFPTHDAILSQAGQDMTDSMLGMVAEKVGTAYERIAPGQSIKL